MKTSIYYLLILAIGMILPGAKGDAMNSYEHPDKISLGLEREQKVSLEGEWRFQEDPGENGDKEQWFEGNRIAKRKVKVPLSWELCADDLRTYVGTAWYEREFQLPEAWSGKRICIGFDGVAGDTRIYINGRLAGEHNDPQTPFLLDVTSLSSPGKQNRITLRVNNPRSGISYFLDTHSLINVSGLWQPVWIEASGQSFISDLFIIPDIDLMEATARICLWLPESERAKEHSIAIRIKGDKKTFTGSCPVPAIVDKNGFCTAEAKINMQKARLWEIENPHLYSVEATLADKSGAMLDQASTEFGMRKIEERNDRIYLNNKPIFLIGGGIDPGPFGGSGDPAWSLPGPYSYPTSEEIEDDIRKLKSTGINLARLPLRAMHPRWLDAAQRMGILAWEEASWRTNFSSLEELLNTWTTIVLRDRNNPAVAIWTEFNEGWGFRADWVGPLYDHIKALDPTRLVLDNSGGASHYRNYPGNHGKSDIEDVHKYPGFELFTRDYWLGLRHSKHPLMVGEFGPIPYMFNLERIKKSWGGQDPWWFSVAPIANPGGRDSFPLEWNHHGYEERYVNWGMEEIYGSWDAFTQAHDWYYFWGLKDQTQALRMNPEMSGWIVWAMDFAQHGTGFINLYHEKKCFADALSKIWTQDLVIIDERRHNYWSGDNVHATLHVSHFGHEDLSGARVEWKLDGTDNSGEIKLSEMPSGSSRIIGDIQFQAPDVGKSTSSKIVARLVDRKGKTLSENFEPIFIYPARDCRPADIAFGIYELPYHVRGAMEAFGNGEHRGFKMVSMDTTPSLAVTTKIDDRMMRYLQGGGTAILIASENQPLLLANGLSLAGGSLGGHCTSFYARKSTGVFDRIPYENPFTWSFFGIWPKHTMLGVKPEQHGDILAGAYINLLNNQASTMQQFRVGKGRLIVTTFDLLEPLVEEPAAAVVFNDLLAYASGNFQPHTELTIK